MIQWYNELLKRDFPDLEVSVNLAVALISTDRASEGEQLLKEVLEEDPNFLSAHNMLGVLYAHRGDWARATEHFARAVQIAPENRTLLQRLRESQKELEKQRNR